MSQEEEKLNFENIAVRISVWSRPAMIYRVLQQLRKVKPPVIHIVCDGPRENVVGDHMRVALVRDVVDREIDWDCKLYKLYHEKNVGMLTVWDGDLVTDSGEVYEESDDIRYICLEDDDLPSVSFFKFCIEMLNRYEDNDDVWRITGNNFQNGNIRGNGSYYFSFLSHAWGLALWKRKDDKLGLDRAELKQIFDKIKNGTIPFPQDMPAPIANYIMQNCNRVFYGDLKNVTNDFLRNLFVYAHKKLTVTPNQNLVKNIGFSPVDGTNCLSADSYMSVDFKELEFPLTHPDEVKPNIEADKYVYKNFYHIPGL